MKTRMMTAVLLTLMAGCVATTVPPASLKLYVMDCGSLRFQDVSSFGLTNDETSVREMFVPCYLIDHPAGQLLWDGGLDPALVGQGEVPLGEGTFMQYERSVVDQLIEIGHPPASVGLIAFSHMHFDHTGAANYFPNARLLIQNAEYEAAFEMPGENPIFTYDYYKELADNPITLLDGDHDVFGDGRVRIISAPGHTPGHQVLYLELTETGPLVLSGDLYHFRFSREHRRVPVFNTDKAQTLLAMTRVEALLEEENATLWIEHDRALADALRRAPAYYE